MVARIATAIVAANAAAILALITAAIDAQWSLNCRRDCRCESPAMAAATVLQFSPRLLQ
jgi:hypothetical protein